MHIISMVNQVLSFKEIITDGCVYVMLFKSMLRAFYLYNSIRWKQIISFIHVY